MIRFDKATYLSLHFTLEVADNTNKYSIHSLL